MMHVHAYLGSRGLLHELHDKKRIWTSPNGIMFTKKHERHGILPRLLDEILATRVMVKTTMKSKDVKQNKQLLRILNARQFALKLIANVTYGYIAAGFSGRMPCAEIADAIVQSGRNTLERAIDIVHGEPSWKARVVYGDTDSLFIVLDGRTKAEAFAIGRAIADRVTAANPKPVKLQLEKVYLPCALVAKKRYVGYKWESPSQTTPVLDAKGIESVRRDQCAAVQKIMDRIIHMLFTNMNISQVRFYLERQWTKILEGKVRVQDFVFAKEVRLGSYRNLPLAALVAHRAMVTDPRAEPLYKERVSYVVIEGPPHARLMDTVVAPEQCIHSPDLYRLNATYYITKMINPSLARLLDLIGIDIHSWYNKLPRPRRKQVINVENKKQGPIRSIVATRNSSFANMTSTAPRLTIDHFYASSHCPACDTITQAGFCKNCKQNPRRLFLSMSSRLHTAESTYRTTLDICHHCVGDSQYGMGSCGSVIHYGGAGHTHNLNQPINLTHHIHHTRGATTPGAGGTLMTPELASASVSLSLPTRSSRVRLVDIECDSLDCPVMFQRIASAKNLQQVQHYMQLMYQTLGE